MWLAGVVAYATPPEAEVGYHRIILGVLVELGLAQQELTNFRLPVLGVVQLLTHKRQLFLVNRVVGLLGYIMLGRQQLLITITIRPPIGRTTLLSTRWKITLFRNYSPYSNLRILTN
jgi:hypothetical protein